MRDGTGRNRQTCVGKSADGQGCTPSQRLDHREHLFGAHGAVGPDDIGTGLDQPRGGLHGIDSHKGLSRSFVAHLGDDRQTARYGCFDRQTGFGEIGHRLHYTCIGSGFGKGFRLQSKGRTSCLQGDVTVGLQEFTQRSYGAQYERLLPHRLTGDGDTPFVDLRSLVRQAEAGQAYGIGSKGVGFHQLSARRHIGFVNASYHGRSGEIGQLQTLYVTRILFK